MNTYYISVVLKVTAETAELAQGHALYDLNRMSGDVVYLQSIGWPTREPPQRGERETL